MIDNDPAISIATLIARPCQRQFSWFTMMKSKYFLEKDVFLLVMSEGHRADPSSVQDECYINFVIDLAHSKVTVAQW